MAGFCRGYFLGLMAYVIEFLLHFWCWYESFQRSRYVKSRACCFKHLIKYFVVPEHFSDVGSSIIPLMSCIENAPINLENTGIISFFVWVAHKFSDLISCVLHYLMQRWLDPGKPVKKQLRGNQTDTHYFVSVNLKFNSVLTFL